MITKTYAEIPKIKRFMSDEGKARVGAAARARTGWTHTNETKQLLGDLKRGKKLSEEHKAKCIKTLNPKANTGRAQPEWERKIRSDALRKRWAEQGCKDSTREKLRQRWVKWREDHPKPLVTLGYETVFDASKKGGRNRTHRVVIEQYVGRPLTTIETVHHIDGVRLNNEVNNLYLCASNREHRLIHASLQKVAFELVRLGVIVFENGVYRGAS